MARFLATAAVLIVFSSFFLPRPGAAAPLAQMAGWQVATAGDAGPRDTKAIVSIPAKGVGVFFTPADGVTYRVYRHDRTNGRRFVPLGPPVTYQVPGSLAAADPFNGQSGDAGWTYDATYDYLVYVDPDVNDYEEYHYLVWSDRDRDGAGAPVTDPNAFLNGYAVASAFPPTQTRHGNYSEYTNACTSCHGLHSAGQAKLLKGPSVTDLCGTCHDGTGSKYDEVRGRVRRGPQWSDSAAAPAGPFGDRLKENSGVVVTSVHNVMRAADVLREGGPDNAAPGSARIWQAPGSGYLLDRDAGQRDGNASGVPSDSISTYVTYDWGSYLVCSSCHEPHNRSQNFRLLRSLINDRTNIVVRGVSEVDPASPFAPSHVKHLSGGGTVLAYFDPRVEDPAWGPGAPDAGDLDGDGDVSEPRARAFCDRAGGALTVGDVTSPSGYRCRRQLFMGGVASFCTACHRGLAWPDAGVGRDSHAYTYGSGGTISGMDASGASNSGGGPLGLTATDPAASIDEVLGAHKHPVSVPAADAYRQGRIVDGVLAADGEVCREGKTLADGVTPDPRCLNVAQGRVTDPIVPLEGQRGDVALSDEPYRENIVTCLTCHVPHGSGSPRLEVAYINPDLNDSGQAQRDPVTGYTQSAVSSALARFSPFSSACYRCHSTTPSP